MPTIEGNSKDNKLVGDSDVFGTTNFIYGYGGNDTLEGGFQADNYIWGGVGNDVLEGGIRLNRLYGGAGDDRISVLWSDTDSRLFGGSGKDTLVSATTFAGAKGIYMDGGSGADLMIGGSGGDTFVVDNAMDRVQEVWVPEFDNQANPIDTVRASVSFGLAIGARIELLETVGATKTKSINLTGNDFDQTIKGNSGRNSLSGKGGNDTLEGGSGDDKLLGGSGKDKLYGGLGADDLYGGAGRDTFVFKTAKESTVASTGRDSIFDFDGKGGDRVDLTAIDAKAASGDQAFTFVGKAAFSKTEGELRYEQKLGQTYVYGDVNGDGKADLAIHLKGVLELSRDYFLL